MLCWNQAKGSCLEKFSLVTLQYFLKVKLYLKSLSALDFSVTLKLTLELQMTD